MNTTLTTFVHQLEQYSDQLVNAFTLGQLTAAKQMYLDWLSGASVSQPDILSNFLAGLFVAVKFCLPLIFFGVVLSKLTRNPYIFVGGLGLVAALYAYLFFDPITTFTNLSYHIQAFREFLADLPSIQTEPFLFTFLTNGAVVFALHILVSFLGSWVFFAVVVGLITLILWILLAGRNPWSVTSKSFKAVTLQLTIAFLIFYAVFGSFKGLLSTFFLFVGMFSIVSGLRTLMGYQKHCYVDSSGNVICRWVK
jgi:hypothetical protein